VVEKEAARSSSTGAFEELEVESLEGRDVRETIASDQHLPRTSANPGALTGKLIPEATSPKKEGVNSLSGIVQRPTAPPREPDAKELDVLLDEFNRVPSFSFQGQPWPAVLAWYAKLAKCTSDWQELPNDYLNLATEQAQPLDEVRNLLNRLLLSRGYVILQRERIVSVYRLEAIDPGVVEQVDEVGLYTRRAYDIAKVVFQLPANVAVDRIQNDLKQILNPKAKVLPLVTTRQLLVIDAVANLRSVCELLNAERAREQVNSPLKQFVLRHRRAEDVIEILYVMLGADPRAKPTQQETRIRQQELQVRQQELQVMQQIARRGADVEKLLRPDSAQVFLIYNSQMNSIVANAPPDQMKMIEETIHWLDVPLGGDQRKPLTGSSEVSKERVFQTHKLRTLDPVVVKNTLDEIGTLSPFTFVKVDSANQAIVVQGELADQEKIAELIKELDGEERFIRVVKLRRFPAEEAAASIRELISGAEGDVRRGQELSLEERVNSPNQRQRQTEGPGPGFCLVADDINNRLLIKANTNEFEQIYNLLKDLGEMPDERQDGVTMRVLEPVSPDLLEQIRKTWLETSGNPLIINVPPKTTAVTKPGIAESAKSGTTSSNNGGIHREPSYDTASVFGHILATKGGEKK
jgi:hypothetical protein